MNNKFCARLLTTGALCALLLTSAHADKMEGKMDGKMDGKMSGKMDGKMDGKMAPKMDCSTCKMGGAKTGGDKMAMDHMMGTMNAAEKKTYKMMSTSEKAVFNKMVSAAMTHGKMGHKMDGGKMHDGKMSGKM